MTGPNLPAAAPPRFSRWQTPEGERRQVLEVYRRGMGVDEYLVVWIKPHQARHGKPRETRGGAWRQWVERSGAQMVEDGDDEA